MSKKISPRIIIFIGAGLLLTFLGFLIYNQYNQAEKEKYELYNDFSRAQVVINLNACFSWDCVYEQVRFQQRTTKDSSITEKDFLQDLIDSELLPSFKILENIDLTNFAYDAFDKLIDFASQYRNMWLETNEDIFIRQSNDKYFVIENREYVYKVKRRVISHDDFKKLYNTYTNNEALYQRFAKIILNNNKTLKNTYSVTEISRLLENKNEAFYLENMDIIRWSFISDLDNFSDYLTNKYTLKTDGFNSLNKDLINQDIKGQSIEVDYKFKRIQSVMNSVVIYYDTLYQLDTNIVKEQLNNLGYPFLYI